jgi:hypothetical protein
MGAAAGSTGTGSGSNSVSGTITGTVPSEMRSFFGSRLGDMGAGFLGGSQQSTQPQGDRFGNQGQFSSGDVTQYVRDRMGDYAGMRQRMAETGVSEADIGRAAGVAPGNVYSYMNRPNYQQYGPSGQFYQPIFRPSYGGYAAPSQFYSPGYGPFGGGFGGYGGAPFGGYFGGMGGGYGSPFMYATGGEIEQDTADENETDDQGIARLLNR